MGWGEKVSLCETPVIPETQSENGRTRRAIGETLPAIAESQTGISAVLSGALGRLVKLVDRRVDQFVRAEAPIAGGLADGPGKLTGNVDRDVDRIVRHGKDAPMACQLIPQVSTVWV